MNYYNDNDPRACAWIRELIDAGLIPPGDIDERSIADIQPTDLLGYTQVHLFAGISGWPLALSLAGYPADEPIWSASCPCPPFSAAGKKKSCPECGDKPIPHPLKTGIFACVECGHEWFADGRHLYPELHRLIRECRPSRVVGEQVAGADGLVWFAGVRATLEALGYGVGGSDLCAAGVSAPHIRQRIYWGAKRLAYATSGGFGINGSAQGSAGHADERSQIGGLADSKGERRDGITGVQGQDGRSVAEAGGGTCGVEHTERLRRPGRENDQDGGRGQLASGRAGEADGVEHSESNGRQQRGAESSGRGTTSGCSAGFWDTFDIIHCRDGKARRIPQAQPGLQCVVDGLPEGVDLGWLESSFPLAQGVKGRIPLLRGFGNAIVPPLAAEFIGACFDVIARPANPQKPCGGGEE